ncbi:MAG: zf-HC2 domain-containing protein [Pyrinomonadaceae bacterium]
MECGKCLDLLSDFIDGTLSTVDGQLVAAHLGECLPCAGVRGDFDLIVKLARELRDEFPFETPPNLKSSIFSTKFQQAAAP